MSYWSQERVCMFNKLKKKVLSQKPPELRKIRWYSTHKNNKNGKQKIQPQQVPPLMVRKPEWRR